MQKQTHRGLKTGIRFMIHISIWKDLILLKTGGSTPPESLEPFARWNEKFNCYLLSFSAQNLRRIHSAYGKIPVAQGQDRIDELKLQLSYFNDCIKEIFRVKDLGSKTSYNYKVPPLATYQHAGVDILVKGKSVPLFASCGMGKTFMVIMSTQFQIEMGLLQRGKTLICGKLNTLETGWLEDFEKFSNLKAVMLWTPSNYKKKEKILKALEEPADVYIINHDGLRVYEEELCSKNFDKVVIDESTILKSYKGSFTRSGGAIGKSLMKIAENATYRVIMSGTPAPNGAEDLWGQFKFLDPQGFLLEPSFNDFKEEYMDFIQFGKTPDAPKKYFCPDDSNKRIHDLIMPMSYRVKIRDHLHDLPEKTIIKRSVYMSKEQEEHYKELLNSLSTVINDEFVSVDIRLAQIAKLRQVTGGFLIDQEEVAHEIETATKLTAFDEIMEEIGDEKVVVYAQYRWEIKTLAERYKEIGAVTVYGDNSSAVNVENIKSFIRDPKVKMVILHPKSAAHGITFTVSHYMIFYSISYSAEDDYQCVARIERASQKHPMFVYYLLSKYTTPPKDGTQETIDETIYKVIRQKNKNQEELIKQDVVSRDILNAFTLK